jgi:hypothetical protein
MLSGLAAGLAGSWIGHMLFGPTTAPAAEHEGSGNLSRQEEPNASGSVGPFAGLLVMVMAISVAAVYYLYKRRNGSLRPAFTGFGSAGPVPRSDAPAWVPASVGLLHPSASEPNLTVTDEEEFRRRLVQIQTAWSRQDIQSLRRIVTPEMVQYFSDKLTENISAGVENRIEDMVVMRAEIREAWAEDTRLYATVLLEWKAQDYFQSLAKPWSDPGNERESEDRVSRDFVEAWTFVKHREGKWLLSAIQQIG